MSQLVSLIDAITAEDLGAMPSSAVADDAVELFLAVDRLLAEAHRRLAHALGTGAWAADGTLSPTVWLANATHTARSTAAGRVAVARLVGRSPLTQTAWSNGGLSRDHASVITAVADTPEMVDLYGRDEAELVPLLAELTPEQARRALARWKVHVAPDAAERTAEQQHDGRHLHASRLLHGRLKLDGLGDADSGSVILAALDKFTTLDLPGEPVRSPGQRRYDALVELCHHGLGHHQAASTTRRRTRRTRPHVSIRVDADGVAEHADGTVLTPAQTRRWLCDAAVRRILRTGSTILDIGRASPTIPTGMRRAIDARDQHCRFPGCDRPLSWCEVHHLHHWVDGGRTEVGNLACLCARHHHLLHRPGWTASLASDGTLVIVNPGGTTVSSRPPP